MEVVRTSILNEFKRGGDVKDALKLGTHRELRRLMKVLEYYGYYDAELDTSSDAGGIILRVDGFTMTPEEAEDYISKSNFRERLGITKDFVFNETVFIVVSEEYNKGFLFATQVVTNEDIEGWMHKSSESMYFDPRDDEDFLTVVGRESELIGIAEVTDAIRSAYYHVLEL